MDTSELYIKSKGLILRQICSNQILGRETWNSNTGFIIAAIGSAVGLGNIWRFPYVAGENGGGAFLIPYAIISILFGFVFMLLEFSIGRKYKTTIIESLGKIHKRFKGAGFLAVLVSFVVLSYYLVIVGWILSFVIIESTEINLKFNEYTDTLYPIFSFIVVLGFTIWIMLRGVSKGIEKLNKIGIVLLVSILIPLTIYGLTLEGAEAGLEYYLKPDYTKLNDPNIWAIAFGQVFFSLSIGSGILLAFASYLQKTNSLIKSTSIIIVSNALVSVIAGLMIFSFVFSYGLDPESGIILVFQALPTAFENMMFGNIIGPIFFMLLLVAGITSAVSLFQVPVSALMDSAKWSKQKSVVIVGIGTLLLGMLSSLGYSAINLKINDTPILDLLNNYFGNYGWTISAALFVVIVTWFIKKEELIKEINYGSRIQLPVGLIYIAKFVVPALVIFSLIVSIGKSLG